MAKRKKKLTGKQRLFLKEKIKNPAITNTEAARRAGYGEGTIRSAKVEKGVYKNINDALEEAGLTEGQLANGLAEGTRALKISYFQKDGIVIQEKVDVDFATRKGYYELIAKIKGYLVDDVNIRTTKDNPFSVVIEEVRREDGGG